MVPISEGDRSLENPYHVIIVRPEDRRPSDLEGTRRFVRYLTSPGTRRMIEEFGKERYGQPLFRPSDTGR
jgi:tungstate transport system substrate-binding protein